MKVRVSSLPEFSCFVGKGGAERKKLDNGRVAAVGPKGRISIRKMKGDPEVEPMAGCPLKLFGVGHRRHPDIMVEIGDGNILSPKRKR